MTTSESATAPRSWKRRRLCGYVGALVAMMVFWAFRSAKAHMTEMSFQLGRDLLPLSDLLIDRARVDINGEHIWAASSRSPSNVHEILDRFESHCREGGATGATWGSRSDSERPAIADIVNARDPKGPEITLGVLRTENGNEGAILCFPKPLASRGFMSKLNAFLDTQDLGELGELRYAYVRRERGTSHVLAMWTEEHLRLDKLVGISDSEPGSDNPDLPRPIRSQRVMSTSIDGTPYGARGYLSQASPEEVLAAYATEMEGRGWTVARTPENDAVGFLKEGSLVTAAAGKSEQGTIVGIAELGVDPRVTPRPEF